MDQLKGSSATRSAFIPGLRLCVVGSNHQDNIRQLNHEKEENQAHRLKNRIQVIQPVMWCNIFSEIYSLTMPSSICPIYIFSLRFVLLLLYIPLSDSLPSLFLFFIYFLSLIHFLSQVPFFSLVLWIICFQSHGKAHQGSLVTERTPRSWGSPEGAFTPTGGLSEETYSTLVWKRPDSQRTRTSPSFCAGGSTSEKINGNDDVGCLVQKVRTLHKRVCEVWATWERAGQGSTRHIWAQGLCWLEQLFFTSAVADHILLLQHIRLSRDLVSHRRAPTCLNPANGLKSKQQQVKVKGQRSVVIGIPPFVSLQQRLQILPSSHTPWTCPCGVRRELKLTENFCQMQQALVSYSTSGSWRGWLLTLHSH